MRVYNLTDIPTPTLTRHGLVNQCLVAHRRVIAPGEYVDVEDNDSMRARLAHLLTVGAVSIDQLPPAYLRDKQQAAALSGTFGSIPVRHIEVRETVPAGETHAVVSPGAESTVTLRSRKKGRP